MTETETMAAADDPAQILGALMEPAGRDDPYPLYAALRAFGPLAPLEEDGIYLCSGYEEINAVLRSPEFGGDTAGKWSAEYRYLVLSNLTSLFLIGGGNLPRERFPAGGPVLESICNTCILHPYFNYR